MFLLNCTLIDSLYKSCIYCIIPSMQNKVSTEKAKQALESERNELSIELQTLMQGKGESEHRRKKAESLVQELQLKYSESERQRVEQAEKLAKVQVHPFRTLYFFLFANGNLDYLHL